jgi:hypothetical protein
MTTQPLPRYGLGERHPLGGRFLDPLYDDGDIARYARVDGFTNLDDVDKHITTNIASARPTFYLVSGESGTGRSAAANYILARHREIAKFAPTTYLVPKVHPGNGAQFVSMKDDDWTRAIKSWMLAAAAVLTVKKQQWGVIDDVVVALKGLRSVTNEDEVASDSLVAIEQLHEELGPARTFAVCIEDLKSPQIVDRALEIFGAHPTLCVFTALGAAYENIVRACQKGSQWAILRLDALAGKDAEKLVGACWSGVSAAPLPFEDGAIAAAFERARPLGRILKLVHRALAIKEINTPGGGAWPHEPLLRYDADTLRRTISLLDGDP